MAAKRMAGIRCVPVLIFPQREIGKGMFADLGAITLGSA